MRTNTLWAVAVCLSLSAGAIVHAQSTYTSPARWNNFYPISDKEKVKEPAKRADTELALPAPATEIPAPAPDPVPAAEPLHSAVAVGNGCQSCQSSPYMHAMSTPCTEQRPMFPWFASSNLLFWTLEEGNGEFLATGLGSDFYSSVADPEATTGFDVSFGRYFKSGRWGVGVTYMNWDPQTQGLTRFNAPGAITSARTAYNDVDLNHATLGLDTVYNHIANNASGMYIKRDLFFQGIEANLFSFGIMGARRAGLTNCCPPRIFGDRSAHAGRYSFGGATGPLARGGGRIRVMTSHGFRWFQAKDFVERGFDVDGTLDFEEEDIYEKVDIENNLYGYQFGARLSYMLTCRLNLNVGGKFGLYGNHVEVDHCIGTRTTPATQTGATDPLCSRAVGGMSDTALATLGELDLGLGYRIGCAWTVRGGYRLLGITGVANAIDSHPASYASLADAFTVKADDNYLLHGGYVGLEFNW